MFVTYYETGTIARGNKRFHRTKHRSKRAAVAKACAISARTRGFVTVMRNGIEVAACNSGKRV